MSRVCVNVYHMHILFKNCYTLVCVAVGQWEYLPHSGVVLRRRPVTLHPEPADSPRASGASLPAADRWGWRVQKWNYSTAQSSRVASRGSVQQVVLLFWSQTLNRTCWLAAVRTELMFNACLWFYLFIYVFIFISSLCSEVPPWKEHFSSGPEAPKHPAEWQRAETSR